MGNRLVTLADLNQLERLSYVLAVIGVPMLMLALILGLQWVFIKVPGVHWYDSKVIGSFIVL